MTLEAFRAFTQVVVGCEYMVRPVCFLILWDVFCRPDRDRADLAGEAAAKAILRAAPERRTREAVEEAADAQRTVLTYVPQEPGEQADRVLSWFG